MLPRNTGVRGCESHTQNVVGLLFSSYLAQVGLGRCKFFLTVSDRCLRVCFQGESSSFTNGEKEVCSLSCAPLRMRGGCYPRARPTAWDDLHPAADKRYQEVEESGKGFAHFKRSPRKFLILPASGAVMY